MNYRRTTIIIIIVGEITILVSLLLTCTERDFLLGNRDFTKAQQRYIRCRLNKKMIKEFISNELTILQDKGYIVGTIAASSNVAGCCSLGLRNTNKSSAGSGNFVSPFPPHQRRGEGNISNPRVLSDMGLAIPRPTRLLPALTAGLGDPRSSLFWSVSCIKLLLLIPCPKEPAGNCCCCSSTLQPGCNTAAASCFVHSKVLVSS
jgi:hypothetical protein